MPYIARTSALPELALSGGLVDPRADRQASFDKRMNCRDVIDFISNLKSSSLESRHEMVGVSPTTWSMPCRKPSTEYHAKLDKILARSREIGLPSGEKNPDQPLSDLVPGLVISGGLSRSPAFDCLPVVSHWTDRTGEASAEDPNATVRLSSTWGTTHLIGEGTTMAFPLGAPCWTLKTHGIGHAEAGSSKFSQEYIPETDTLTTTINLERRIDTPQTGGTPSIVQSGSLANAAALLEARDKVVTTGTTEHLAFAEVRAVEMPSWCSARKPLPPKLSGVALSPDQATTDLIAAESCEGPLLNTSIFSMGIGYNRGVYGGSISGLWALMDSAAVAEVAASAGPHITDIRIVKGCNYACLRQKTIIEDAHPVPSRSCVVIWDDLAQLARYKLADAVFCHVYYDAGGGEHMAAIAGLGCVAHDWIDIGADVACGEVSNIIPSLTGGSLEEEPLAEVYSRLTGTMIWYRDNDPYNPAALCLLFTHWWQLANCRHRPISLLGRTDLGVASLCHAEARLQSILASNPLPETRAVIDLLVNPVLAYVKGADSLPSESEYVGAVLAAELAYPHGQKIIELWDLAIVMWECGALWAAGVAGLCYTHTGKANCDRAREDLADTTWT
ncbi:hypothetical protein N7453_005505 [Penicillium expansum]|nr:hypothetical protein N7453_005505 [Penicillium expansum]